MMGSPDAYVRCAGRNNRGSSPSISFEAEPSGVGRILLGPGFLSPGDPGGRVTHRLGISS